MNGLTVRSKIHVWIATLCVIALFSVTVTTVTFWSDSTSHTMLDLGAVVSNHEGSSGSGGG